MQTFASMSLVLGYFDPGSGSLVLQSIVGGTAGLMVFGNYLWALLKDQFRGR
ncbi:MAG: hypothetical protein IAG10_30855 [Planctomycetaceae bacterium]|nr:hypothetical protein [Planctomycetaceae bacterium]